MPSEHKTKNFKLNQWEGNEYPKREDFVNDNLIIDTELKATQDKVKNIKIGEDDKPAFDYLTVGTRGEGDIGENSFASGTDNIASGINSHAEGYLTKALGEFSHVEGYGSYAHSAIYYTINSFDNKLKTLTLDRITDLSVNDKVNIVKHGELLEPIYDITIKTIDTDKKSITLDTTETLDSSCVYVTKLVTEGSTTHAEGRYTVAFGGDSHAEGNRTRAIGAQSHAEGYNTTASGLRSHVEGTGAIASGYASHAEGYHTKALSDVTHAEGSMSTAIGKGSHVEGLGNQAHDFAHAEGIYNFAGRGYLYTVTGYDNNAKTLTLDNVNNLSVGSEVCIVRNYEDTNQYYYTVTAVSGNAITISTSENITDNWKYVVLPYNDVDFACHAEGVFNVSTGDDSHVEGRSNISSSLQSHAEGYGTKATGPYAHTEGFKTTANNYFTHAEGNLSSATGWCSHAEGDNTTASGNYSHAEGYYTSAYGDNSHSGGSVTAARSTNSFAHGLYVEANTTEQAVFGRYNVPHTSALFVVGNGTSNTSRSNAFVIENNILGGSAVSTVVTPTSPVGMIINGGYLKIGRMVTYAITIKLTSAVSVNGYIVHDMPQALAQAVGVLNVSGSQAISQIFMYSGFTSLQSAVSLSSGQTVFLSGSYISAY